MTSLSKDGYDAYEQATWVSYCFGLIGLNELNDRIAALRCLHNEQIPLESTLENHIPENIPDDWLDFKGRDHKIHDKSTCKPNPDQSEEIIHFTPLGLPNKWVFTIGDVDCFPSIPHGHLNSSTQAHPKLNPYTGSAYNKHKQICSQYSLKKKEVNILWNDQSFRDHCLKQIHWFMGNYPQYIFRVSNPKKLPRRR